MSIPYSIAGVYYIYPPCYVMPCYAVLYSSCVTKDLALGFTVDIALRSPKCYGGGAIP